jgi:hypothetical protein
VASIACDTCAACCGSRKSEMNTPVWSRGAETGA